MSDTEKMITELFAETNAEITRSFQTEEAMKEYLDFRMKIDNYSVHNMTMIKAQCPRAQMVRSYQYWKEQGAFIHRGEHGIRVLIPSGSGSSGFKTGYVFDIAQTTLDEAKKQELLQKEMREQIKKEEEERFLQGVIEVGKGEHITISFSAEECQKEHGKCYPADRTIFINPEDDVHTQAMTASRLLSLMMLETELPEGAKEQLQSEMVLYMLHQYYGMEGTTHLEALENLKVQEMTPKEQKILVDGAYKMVQRLTESLNLFLKEHPVVEPLSRTEQKTEQEQPEQKKQTEEGKPEKKLEDFGKKIGGAKKDLWAERGLQLSDLDGMTELETDKYVTKDNIWKKPDYNKMIQEGTPIRIAFFIKKIRDALPVKAAYSYKDDTAEKRRIRKENYISLIRDVMDMTAQVKDETDMFQFRDKFIERGDYVERFSSSYILTTEKGMGISNKLLRAMAVSKYSLSQMDQKIKKEQFGVSAEDKLPRGFQVRYLREDNKYCVLQNHRIVAEGLESQRDAIERAKELSKQGNTSRKKKYVPPQLERIERNGPETGVSEEHPADGELYMKDFGFPGGEFGNWMNAADRQVSMNMGYDAFCDLAYALEIEKEEISLGHELSIAFGARGSGNAAAHYEPDREVINLTKMKGAGSLAHEWGHAFDDIIGRHLGLGGFMSANIRDDVVPESMKELVKAMRWKPATDSGKSEYLKIKRGHAEKLLERAFGMVVREQNLDENQQEEWKQIKGNIEKELHEYPDEEGFDSIWTMIDELSTFKKKITGHIIKKDSREQLRWMLFNAKQAYNYKADDLSVETDFYKNSVKADTIYSKEGKGYWKSTEEMFARAFACYIHDKLPWRSDYLCGHSESAVFMDYSGDKAAIVKAIPQGEEREMLNQCFDKMFEECRERGILKSQEMAERKKVRRMR